MVLFQVLKCCFCNMFQVQQEKKATKFRCKVCNENQSYKKIWYEGEAKLCRKRVQELNKKYIEGQSNIIPVSSSIKTSELVDEEKLDLNRRIINEGMKVTTTKKQINLNYNPYNKDESKQSKVSKWDKFLEPKKERVNNPNDPFLFK